jgi:hypothetical protein
MACLKLWGVWQLDPTWKLRIAMMSGVGDMWVKTQGSVRREMQSETPTRGVPRLGQSTEQCRSETSAQAQVHWPRRCPRPSATSSAMHTSHRTIIELGDS